MKRVSKFINNLSRKQKLIFLIVICFVLLFITVFIPTYARYRNRVVSNEIEVWDGSVASSYKSGDGSQNNPYIISNGSELAYFCNQSISNNYEDKYFSLSNDIVLNSGVFNYIDNNITYKINDTDYFVNDSKYYSNKEFTEFKGNINKFNSINNFKGIFNGNSFRIIGLYINDSNNYKVSLFNDLQGDINNLYIENSIVKGGNFSSLLASSTNGSNISDVMVNGFVIGNNNTSSLNSEFNIDNKSIDLISNTDNTLNLSNDIYYGSEIVSTKLVGNYTSTNSSNIKINDNLISDGSFDIDLGNTLKNNVSIVSDSNTTANFTNLKYIITYKNSISSGLVASSVNSTFKNVINKADVYGNYISSGLIGNVSGSLLLENSYNTGLISSNNISSGLIGVINSTESVDILKSYNSGSINSSLKSGLIGAVNNSSNVSLNKIFNTTNNNCINKVINSNISVTNSYYTSGNPIGSGSYTLEFTSTSLDNLKKKSFINLEEFVSLDNLKSDSDNVWVYTDNLPILYIDDSNNIANINVGVNYSWNNYSTSLKTVAFSSNIVFNIESVNKSLFSDSYYYICKDEKVLSLNDLSKVSWIKYSDIVKITDEGKYVVYVKVIDINNNASYINTDLLVLHKSGSNIDVKSGSYNWNKRIDNLNNLYFADDFDVEITASNDYFNIKDISYYTDDKYLTDEELKNINTWTKYSEKITYNDLGTYVIYAKVTDSSGFVSYANSDKIIYDGYIQNKVLVSNQEIKDSNVNITRSSSIVYNFTNSKVNGVFKHVVSLNKELPVNTNIIIIDNINKNKYQYVVKNNDYDTINNKIIYPFSKFSIVGSVNKYSEKNISSSEDYSVIIDFSNTNINNNYLDYKVSLELYNDSNECIKPTISKNLKNFNLYNTDSELFINSNNSNSIIYNSDSINNIDINVGYNYKNINGYNVLDSSYDDKMFGIAIKLLDSDNKVVDKSYYKNLIFKIGDKQFYTSYDNVLRISLDETSKSVNKTLSIETKFNTNSTLKSGVYSLQVSLFTSYDGIYFNDLSNKKINIPVIVSNTKENIKYGFNVTTNNNRIINKLENTNIDFSITNNNLSDLNVLVSLYKKNSLSYMDQSYSIIDLKDYVTSNLTLKSEKLYLINGNGLSLDFNPLTLQQTGYKFVFDLYKENKKIETINKYFIVR